MIYAIQNSPRLEPWTNTVHKNTIIKVPACTYRSVYSLYAVFVHARVLVGGRLKGLILNPKARAKLKNWPVKKEAAGSEIDLYHLLNTPERAQTASGHIKLIFMPKC